MRRIVSLIVTSVLIVAMMLQFTACTSKKYYNSADVRKALDNGTDIVGSEVVFVIEDKESVNMYLRSVDPNSDYHYTSSRVDFVLDSEVSVYWGATSEGDTICGVVNEVIPYHVEALGLSSDGYIVHITPRYHSK